MEKKPVLKKTEYQINDIEPLIQKVLSQKGSFSFYPHGTSMLPMIVEDRDQVILTHLPEKPKKYQIILYKRKNGAFVLHRIVGVAKDRFGETYTMRGDNQYQNEYGIRKEQMIGMVCGIVKNGKTVDPLHGLEYAKAVLWVNTVRLRQGVFFARRCVSKIKRILLENSF